MGNRLSFLRSTRVNDQSRTYIWTNTSKQTECLFLPELKCVISQDHHFMSITLLASINSRCRLAKPNMQLWYDAIIDKLQLYCVYSTSTMYALLLGEVTYNHLRDSIEYNLKACVDYTTDRIYRYDSGGLYVSEVLDRRDRDRITVFTLTERLTHDVTMHICALTHSILCHESVNRVHALL